MEGSIRTNRGFFIGDPMKVLDNEALKLWAAHSYKPGTYNTFVTPYAQAVYFIAAKVEPGTYSCKAYVNYQYRDSELTTDSGYLGIVALESCTNKTMHELYEAGAVIQCGDDEVYKGYLNVHEDGVTVFVNAESCNYPVEAEYNITFEQEAV